MTKRRFGFSWLTLAMMASVAGLVFGACSDAGESDSDDDSSSSGGAGSSSATTSSSASASSGGGSATSSSTSQGGSTTNSTAATGNVPACEGIVTTEDAVGVDGECSGVADESEPIPVDMIILMDRSISNSYAVGTSTTATTEGTSRWDVLTAAMSAVATNTAVQDVGASITFFSYDGGSAEDPNCVASNYSTPVVELAPLSTSGPAIVTAMEALTPRGLTPLVPALEGTYVYAVNKRLEDSSREKVVVLISDGYPTLCEKQTIEDVKTTIETAANATTPIRTFIIGVGDPDINSSLGRWNLINYATKGQTGSPYLIDETQDIAGVTDQMTTALLNITQDPVQCEYVLDPPEGTAVDVSQVAMTYEPSSGDFQEIPKVSGLAGCAASANGGWYFDNATAPTKITVCPCTCANFGAGTVSVVYGCVPTVVAE